MNNEIGEIVATVVKLGAVDRKKIVDVINVLNEAPQKQTEQQQKLEGQTHVVQKNTPVMHQLEPKNVVKRQRKKAKRKRITDAELKQYLELREQGMIQVQAAAVIGRASSMMYGKIWKDKLIDLINRMPELEKYRRFTV